MTWCSSEGFRARNDCSGIDGAMELLWNASDIVIFLSYLSIPLTLFLFRRLLPHGKAVVTLFMMFIILCGVGHGFSVFTFYIPTYRLELSIKILTAVVSLMSAAAIWTFVGPLKQMSEINKAQKRTIQNLNEALRNERERNDLSDS